MPISELQARIFFEALTGKVKLPTEKEMMQDVIFKKKEMATNILLNLGLYRMLRPIFHRG